MMLRATGDNMSQVLAREGAFVHPSLGPCLSISLSSAAWREYFSPFSLPTPYSGGSQITYNTYFWLLLSFSSRGMEDIRFVFKDQVTDILRLWSGLWQWSLQDASNEGQQQTNKIHSPPIIICWSAILFWTSTKNGTVGSVFNCQPWKLTKSFEKQTGLLPCGANHHWQAKICRPNYAVWFPCGLHR